MTPYDKELIKKRFAKHLEQYNIQSTVQMDICTRIGFLMNEHIKDTSFDEKKGYEIGAGTGFLTKILLNKYSKTQWLVNDLVEQTKSYLNNIVINSEATSTQIDFFDAETKKPNGKYAIIASASAVQWFNSLYDYIKQISEHIEKDGYFVFSTFGPDNFKQISTLTADSPILYHEKETIEQWAIDAGFDVIHSEQYHRDMYFNTPHDAVKYIKETGINANSKKKWTRIEFESFCTRYAELYTKDDSVMLTFNPMIFILRKR